MPENREAFKLAADGALTTGVKDRWQAPFNGEIVGCAAVVGTAPTGAALILDLQKDGVTMFSTVANRPTIPIAGTESGAVTAPDIKTFSAGDTMSLNVVQIGSTVAGSDLDFTVEYILR